MTQVFPFVPNVQAPFAFQPTLDRLGYTATVTWNLFGQRWYLNVNELTGGLVFSLPLLGSPDGTDIESVAWAFGKVTAKTARPHNYTVGLTVQVTISGCAPDAYNGTVAAYIVDVDTFTYQVAANPGDATLLGAQIYNIDMAAGYFDASTLVYRESSQTFEVTP